MAALKAPVLAASGEQGKDVTLDDAVFGVEIKPHLVHEAVRSELNAQRAGTFATKSRGLVSGGRVKPWRQKGTGRARAGTTRAAQFTGGGHAFAKTPRTFNQKVNRKAAKAAFRSALASHASRGTLALLDARDVRGALDEAREEHPRDRLARAADRRRPVRGRGGGGEVVPQPSEGRGRRAVRARRSRPSSGPARSSSRSPPLPLVEERAS